MGIRRFLRSFVKAFLPFFRVHPFAALLTVIWLGGVATLGVVTFYRAYLETPQHRQAREADDAREAVEYSKNAAAQRIHDEQLHEAEKERNAADKKRNAEVHALCRVKAACAKYATARQECATAGNFELCLNIKMDEDAVYQSSCSNDGHMLDLEHAPNALDCALH
ncbi:MAG: hypothetical protein JSS29_11015 [Proteobacteria bacterium]|nr:hypothetical protein [Pseudomonadota bacterium]